MVGWQPRWWHFVVVALFAAGSSAVQANSRIVLALGDSITAGSGEIPARSYPRALAEIIPDLVTVNGGVVAETTDGVLRRLTRTIGSVSQLDYVLIMYGVNDAILTNGPIPRTAPPVTVVEYERNLIRIITEVRQAGAVPILLTPSPMTKRWAYSNVGLYASMNDINEFLRMYVEAVKRVGLAEQVDVVDVHAAFASRAEWEELIPDGVHPNATGLQLIANAVASHLRSRRRPATR